MTSGIQLSQRLEEWAKLADYTLTPSSSTRDGRPIFWSGLGESRLFVGKKPDGWLVITDSDRMESEWFVLAAPSVDTIEKYLFGKFGMYIRGTRNLPRIGVPVSAGDQHSDFNIETREYEGVERFALVAPDGSAIAVGSADKITATADLKKLALYLNATIDQIEASMLDPDGKPLFERR